ncbi:hypothetical protein D5F01_LYC01002 [Larimichthys crocea]|uniref:ribonuclease H n=1 Tax=Larimichthys crocea TaxID=215358 RepID=A0A6G0JB79_LARCR|nr:hypothetical protein D5F01_LYC01002 [Larimichthys crocea]
MISAQGVGQPQTVQMTNESMLSITPDRNLMEEMLQQVQECLWSQHNTDVGLVKSAQPVRVELRPGTKPPWRPQYPLKEEAVQGIEPQIEGLLQAGVLKTTNDPQSNMPLLPTKKPDGSYRHVHDLRAINEVVIDYPADVPDPHTLLAQIPPEATCFTVIDLCGAFFSVPLAEESQGLFGFTYKGQSYEYTRLPMGFKHSPHLFNKVLKDDLEGVGSQEQTKNEEHRGATILPGDKVFVKVFCRKWFHPCREGPFQVLRSTGTAVQVEGSPTWFHVNHCIKAPEDNEGDGEQPRDTESGDDPEEEQRHNDDDGSNVDHASASMGAEGHACFDTIDFQHAPEPTEPQQGRKSTPDQPVEPRSPRPVREIRVPIRFKDYS